MTFQEIFQEDGLYKADGFAQGVAFKIEKGSLSMITYTEPNQITPEFEENIPIYKGLFDKTYEKVWTRQSLFK